MVLWRLATRRHAHAFDGGYGLLFDGRWNSVGHAVTYCATSPALCVLEKLVHVQNPDLLPELVMVRYAVPDAVGVEVIELDQMPGDWRRREVWTQQRGDEWHRAQAAPLLRVPSAIVPIAASPDMNVVINHLHPAAAGIRMSAAEPFVMDPRLL